VPPTHQDPSSEGSSPFSGLLIGTPRVTSQVV